MRSIDVFIVLLLFGFTSCSFIRYASISEKKNENMPSANRYLNQLGIDTSHSYQISYDYHDSISVRKFAINTYKLKVQTSASPVQLRMYSNTGKFIYGWSQCFGNLKRLGLLDSIPLRQVSHLPVNYDLSLQNDLQLFDISIEQQNTLIHDVHEYDFVIIAFWSMWAGWYSKDLLSRLNDYVGQHSDKNILLIKFNTANGYPE